MANRITTGSNFTKCCNDKNFLEKGTCQEFKLA
jgi:hypothetical protein